MGFASRAVGAAFVAIMVLVASGCASKRITADLAYFPPPPAPPHVVHLKSFNRLSALVARPASLAALLRGRPASPYVASPAGIAYRDGHLYICDTYLDVVHDWDLTTGKAKRLGNGDDGRLASPVAVAVDKDGYVYVADTERSEVLSFDRFGVAARRFAPPDREKYKPVAVAVANRKLYVADIADHRIDAFSLGMGVHQGSIGGAGSDPGMFYYPMGIAADDAGRLVVSDMMNARVHLFDADHTFLSTFGEPGDRYGDLGKPKQVAVGPDGTIFIADADFARVHLFNKEGQLLMLLGGRDQVGATPMPYGVAIAPTLPTPLADLVPDGFTASYFLFVTNSVGPNRISLYAIGS